MDQPPCRAGLLELRRDGPGPVLPLGARARSRRAGGGKAGQQPCKEGVGHSGRHGVQISSSVRTDIEAMLFHSDAEVSGRIIYDAAIIETASIRSWCDAYLWLLERVTDESLTSAESGSPNEEVDWAACVHMDAEDVGHHVWVTYEMARQSWR